MASSGKKGKKTKGKTLALNDFLQETTGSTPSLPIRKTNLSWADEVEDPNEFEARPKINVVLPTAPKASRGVDEYNERIPKDPPYIAYLTNLPYDVDEEEIESLFSHLKIANTRFPKEDRASDLPRLKGYGYIEFEDRDSLVHALAMPDCVVKNRRIRIEVGTSLDNDKQRRGRNDMNRDRIERSDTGGDWRSGPRGSEFSDFSREREGGFSRDRDGGFNRERDGGFNRERDGGFNRDREGGGGFNRDRDRDRDGGNTGGLWRDSTDRPNRSFNREGFGDRGRYGGDRDGGERRGFGPRRDRDDFSRNRDEEKPSEPRMRPKLVLAPRSKPIETDEGQQKQQPSSNVETTAATPASTGGGVPAASIFGAARPVDTAAREREIESKLAKEQERLSRDSSRERSDVPPPVPRKEWSTGGGGRRVSPRRGSTERRKYSPRGGYSPRRYSPRGRGSPVRYAPRRGSPRRGSPVNRRYSPPRRSPTRYSRRRDSPGGRFSPRRGRDTPTRRDSPGRYSPRRKESPGRYSPRRRDSSGRGGDTPTRRDSPVNRYSPARDESPSSRRPLSRDGSPRRYSSRRSPSSSPPRNKDHPNDDDVSVSKRIIKSGGRSSSSNASVSPERNGSAVPANYPRKDGGDGGRRISPVKDRTGQAPDKRKGVKKSPERQKKHDDKKNTKDKNKKDKRDSHEMPKLKEPEPPNFAVSNKYAFLAEGEDVDVSD